jgi:hypothetical protein
MSWEAFKIKNEWVYMDMSDLYAAVSRGNMTDLYTTIFPEGITVDEEITEIMTKHAEATYANISDKDGEDESPGHDSDGDIDSNYSVSFEPDGDTGIVGTFIIDSDILVD